jgi:hypothetical protein
MPISAVDQFLETLPRGTLIEVDALAYGLRQIAGDYCGRAPGDHGAIVIETRTRHVVDVERVETVCCPVSSAGAAAIRLHQSVPRRARVVVSTATGAAVSGAFEGINDEHRVELDRDTGSTSVALDEVTGIAFERRS